MTVAAATLGLVALGLLVSCADLPTAASEQLDDPGPTDGAVDAALSFDGVDDYVTTGTARFPKIDRPQTQMLRVKSDVKVAGRQALLVLRLNHESGTVLALDDGVPLVYNIEGKKELARADAPPSLGHWHHLAAVFDASGTSLYVDGVLAQTGAMPETKRTPNLGFLGSLDGSAELFRGQLDEVRIYDRALVAQEIADEAVGKHAEGDPLVLYLPFNESAGARAYDRSGLGNHAELGDGIAEFMPHRVPTLPSAAP
jgi:Concanavalin A-like lectin/glucanases superfamily